MMRAFRLLVAAFAAAGLLLPNIAAAAQAGRAKPNRIRIDYVAPKNPAHREIYRKLKEIRALEDLRAFLSPFRLPRTLLVKTEGCDGDPNAFYEDGVITICYEYIEQMWRNAPTETTADGITPVDALVAPVFDTALHEFGHAIFEIYKVPVFGREEDAADQVAAFIALQLGKAESRRQIGGTAYAFFTEAIAETQTPKLERFANEHGTPAQRYYNVLCIAYGADPKLFGDLVAKGHLPQERAAGCASEYRQAKFAFETLIGPHIDLQRAKKVLKKSWLPEPAALDYRPAPGR